MLVRRLTLRVKYFTENIDLRGVHRNMLLAQQAGLTLRAQK